jgi:Xaa-Pro dipeptidase
MALRQRERASAEIGDVFTCELGLYNEPILRAGMRIENDYLVTETGIENLCAFPMEL